MSAGYILPPDRALETAVLTGDVQEIQMCCARREMEGSSAHALALACRYAGPAVVEELVRCGASFHRHPAYSLRPAEGGAYEAYLMPGYAYANPGDATLRETGLPENDRRSIVRILHAHGFDLSDLLYYAVLHGDDAVYDELLHCGAELSGWQVRMMLGQWDRFVMSLEWIEEEWVYFRTQLKHAGAEQLASILRRITQDQRIERIKLYEIDFVTGGSLDLRYVSRAVGDAALTCTNLLDVIPALDAAAGVISEHNAEGLEYILACSAVASDRDVAELQAAVRSTGPAHQELMAALLRGRSKASSAAGDRLDITDSDLLID